MPETKEKPNQNTMFSTSTQPPKTADTKAGPAADGKKPTEPPKTPDSKATPAADAKKPAEPPKTPDTKTAPAADGKKSTEPPKAPDAKAIGFWSFEAVLSQLQYWYVLSIESLRYNAKCGSLSLCCRVLRFLPIGKFAFCGFNY